MAETWSPLGPDSRRDFLARWPDPAIRTAWSDGWDHGREAVEDALALSESEVVRLRAERDRLRDGIRDHREAVYAELTCCGDCRAAGKRPSHTSAHDARLWALLDQEATDG